MMRIRPLPALLVVLALSATGCSLIGGDPSSSCGLSTKVTSVASAGHSAGSGNGQHGADETRKNGGSSGARGPAASPAPAAALLPATPTALPAFTCARLQELLGQLRGTPVVVHLWASWCGPCIAEAPVIAQGARTYAGRIQFLGVDSRDQLDPARKFVNQHGWTFPSVFDGPGAVWGLFGFFGLPDTLFYDATGALVATWQGPILSRQELAQKIQKAFG